MGMAGGDFGVGKNLAFTHHQKFVVMDAPKEGGDKRELLGFIGGIDITKGRWDNRKVSRVSYVVTSHYFILLIYSSHCSLL
jgi:hypothetical protein